MARFDLVQQELAAPAVTRDGFARLQGFITRTGVFEYVREDGSIQRELRLPEEVFRPETLASFDGLPFTVDHPPVMLDPSNALAYSRGTVMRPARAEDGEHVRADVMVLDAEAQAAVRSTHQQLSCGYFVDHEPIPGGVYQGDGPFKGVRADVLQKNIEGNHLAAVPRGRAGPTARLRLDAAGNAISSTEKETKKVSTKKIKLHGIEVEVDAAVADALEREEARRLEVVKAADAAAGERDALKAQIEASKKDNAPEKFAAAVKARAELAAAVVALTGCKLDELAKLDEAGMVDFALAAKGPKISLEGKSADYRRALFDALVTAGPSGPTATERLNGAIGAGGGASNTDEAQKATDEYHSRLLNAWKPTQKVG